MQTLAHLLLTYGYFALAACIALESAGIPLPGETALLVAAAAAGTGQLRLSLVILVAALAAIVGDAGGYWLGRRGGRAILERHGRWLHLDAAKLARIERYFVHHGPPTVFFGRFVGILRTYTALFAGISGMPYLRFTVFNVLGGIVWAALFSSLGYGFGRNLAVVEHWVRLLGWGGLLIVGLVGLTVVCWRALARRQDRIGAAYARVRAQPWLLQLHARYQRPWAWLRARLTPGGDLGLHLTVGLALSVSCLGLFGGVAEDLVTHDPLVAFDLRTAALLHRDATPAGTALALAISAFGAPIAVALGLLVPAVYGWRRRWLHVGTWLGGLGGGEALNLVLKQVFARPRPLFVDPLLREPDFSFPSGHVMAAVVVYGLLAYFAVLVLRSWRARSGVVCAATLLVVLIGCSRLYLGLHYVSDVLAGFAAAGLWLSTCITAMELVRRGEVQPRAWRRWPAARLSR